MRAKSRAGRSAGLLVWMCLAVSASVAVAADTTCSITLKPGEEGNLTARGGDTVTVCLPLSSGTGYSWQVQTGGDAFTLQPKSSFERSGPPQPGAAGFTRFTMQPQKPGDYTLVFMLVPPGNTAIEAGRAIVGLKVTPPAAK